MKPQVMKYLLAALLGVAVNVGAATLTVTNLSNTGTGSLRQAILDALPNDIITFSSGVTGTIALATGELVVATNLTINGPGATMLEISGGNVSRVFNVTGGVVSISGLTMTHGRHQGDDGFGGMIPGDGLGGAIFNAATLGLEGCVISGCAAYGGENFDPGPGGLGHGGGIANTGFLSMTNCTVDGNQARGGDCTSQGTAGDGRGGGIYSDGTLTLYRCTLVGNTAVGGLGGGGGGGGGGNNGLAQGGGLYLGGTSELTLCTMSGNYATSLENIRGHGIEVGGTTLMRSCTVVDNGLVDMSVPNRGGGINVNGVLALTIQNSIVALNRATQGPDVYSDVVSQGHNLISVSEGSSGWVGMGDQTGTKVLPLDPMIRSVLEPNGGPTLTHALRWGSPAMDQGNSAGVSVDQRGESRYDDPTLPNAIGGDGTDIGSYEAAALWIVEWEKLGSDLKLGHTSLRDRNYHVVSRTNIASGGWITNLSNLPGNGGINQVTLTNVGTTPELYIRVQQSP